MSDLRSCTTCSNSYRPPKTANGPLPMLQCRAYPPSAQAIIAMGSHGPQVVGAVTTWPEMKDSDYCRKEWAPKVMI